MGNHKMIYSNRHSQDSAVKAFLLKLTCLVLFLTFSVAIVREVDSDSPRRRLPSAKEIADQAKAAANKRKKRVAASPPKPPSPARPAKPTKKKGQIKDFCQNLRKKQQAAAARHKKYQDAPYKEPTWKHSRSAVTTDEDFGFAAMRERIRRHHNGETLKPKKKIKPKQ